MNLAERAHRLTVQRFGKTVQMYAPLYLSNECVNTCLYCGFSRPNKIRRRSITLPEVLKEADYLIEKGFAHLLLVAGEDLREVSLNFLIDTAKALRPKIASLSIEVAPFHYEDYCRLAKAGVDGVVLYQETYNEEAYKRVHLAGPKKNYHNRLQFVEEACQAGMRKVGIGVLLGLHDWKEERNCLIRHARHLMKKYWRTEFSISLPRLKPSASGYLPPHPVSDEDLATLFSQLRLNLPEVGLVLSTRERPELRDRLLKLGITEMSAGSKTEPGGYCRPDESERQFELEDQRSPAEVAKAIRNAGYEPLWKNNVCFFIPSPPVGEG